MAKCWPSTGGVAASMQVDLAVAEVDPGPAESEVGPVAAHGPAEDVGVEGHGPVDVGHVDGDVMDGERSHALSLPRR